MARLNVYVMWFLPAVLLWMCIDVEGKGDINAGRTTCRLNCSDVHYNSLWGPFDRSLAALHKEVKGSRAYPLNISDIWKFCKRDLLDSRRKRQQYKHLFKFSAALGIVCGTCSEEIVNLTNDINDTLKDLLNNNNNIWIPNGCARRKVVLSKSCKARLTAPNEDRQKENLETLVEMVKWDKTGRSANQCQKTRKTQRRRGQKKNKKDQNKKQTSTTHPRKGTRE